MGYGNNPFYLNQPPIITWKQLHSMTECERCEKWHVLISKHLTNIGSSWGVWNNRIAWRVRCQNRNCQKNIGIILKPNLPKGPIGPAKY